MRKEITLAEIIGGCEMSNLKGGEAGTLCVSCGQLFEDKYDMQMIYDERGICKRCWNFDDSEDEDEE